jgi:hypothetical protein
MIFKNLFTFIIDLVEIKINSEFKYFYINLLRIFIVLTLIYTFLWHKEKLYFFLMNVRYYLFRIFLNSNSVGK